MHKKLYEEKKNYSDEEISSARKSLFVLGLGFIAMGSWGLWKDSDVEKVRGILDFFLSFLEPGDRAPALFYSCIASGIFLLLCSRMKPYGKRKRKD